MKHLPLVRLAAIGPSSTRGDRPQTRPNPTAAKFRRKVAYAKTHCTHDVTDEACAEVWTDILEMTRYFYEKGELYELFDDLDESAFD